MEDQSSSKPKQTQTIYVVFSNFYILTLIHVLAWVYMYYISEEYMFTYFTTYSIIIPRFWYKKYIIYFLSDECWIPTRIFVRTSFVLGKIDVFQIGQTNRPRSIATIMETLEIVVLTCALARKPFLTKTQVNHECNWWSLFYFIHLSQQTRYVNHVGLNRMFWYAISTTEVN